MAVRVMAVGSVGAGMLVRVVSLLSVFVVARATLI
jgi:hypothetical protein